jgi:hypothetical protein
LDEGINNALDGNTGANPSRQSGDEQSEQDVSFPQTKNIQNDNGNHDRVRKQSHTRKIFRQERFLGKKKACKNGSHCNRYFSVYIFFVKSLRSAKFADFNALCRKVGKNLIKSIAFNELRASEVWRSRPENWDRF